jgi:hypothetical protein
MDDIRPQELPRIKAKVLHAWEVLRAETRGGPAKLNARRLQDLLGIRPSNNRPSPTHTFLKPLLVPVENDITGGQLFFDGKSGTGAGFPISYEWNGYYAFTVVAPWLQRNGLIDENWKRTPAADAILEGYLERAFGAELKSGLFNWSEPKANRYFHPLQLIKNKGTGQRSALLAKYGYIVDYDVKCCAPTIIYQMARRAGSTVATPMLDEFLADRASVRTRVAGDLGCTYEEAKDILMLAFNGQKLRKNTTIRSILSGVKTRQVKGNARLVRGLTEEERETFESKCSVVQPYFDEAGQLLSVFGDITTARLMNEIYFPRRSASSTLR